MVGLRWTGKPAAFLRRNSEKSRPKRHGDRRL